MTSGRLIWPNEITCGYDYDMRVSAYCVWMRFPHIEAYVHEEDDTATFYFTDPYTIYTYVKHEHLISEAYVVLSQASNRPN